MTAVRRVVGAILRYLTPLYILLIFIQVFLAGEGIFGMKEGQSVDDAKSLDAHRGFGFFLTDLGAIVFVVLALLWWPRNKRVLGLLGYLSSWWRRGGEALEPARVST